MNICPHALHAHTHTHSASESSMEALKQNTIRTVAIIGKLILQ